MARGRRTNPKLVKGMSGSELAKLRLETILETFAGTLSVNEACARLGMGTSAFHKLRAKALSGALGSLEPGKVGRPSASFTEQDAHIADLQTEVQELKIDLEASRIREELAIAMPHVLEQHPDKPAGKGKRRRKGKKR